MQNSKNNTTSEPVSSRLRCAAFDAPTRVRVKLLSPSAVMPTKAHATDAGFDLTAISREYDEHGNVVYHFGLAFEIPDGYVGLIFPRSSVCRKDLLLSNAVGVIDSGYRGEVTAKFKLAMRAKGDLCTVPDTAIVDHWGTSNVYGKGERIAQLIIIPLPRITLVESADLSDSERGEGGYGSTGR
jgi:dUTP pyrophosphatase